MQSVSCIIQGISDARRDCCRGICATGKCQVRYLAATSKLMLQWPVGAVPSWYPSRLEPLSRQILFGVLDQEAEDVSPSQQRATKRPRDPTDLYHHTVGPTVPRCHKLCASMAPQKGGKSSNSRLIASTIHATISPGQAAHGFLSLW